MLGRWLVDFWRGTVVVNLRGPRVPEVLNLATNQGILFWEIRQKKNGDYRLEMHREDVKRMRPIIRQTGTKFRLERKSGIPFLAWRAWRRKFFLAGALTFLVSLYVLSSIVWTVEVEGAEKRISPETIEQAAASIGIHRGVWIGNLPDADELQRQLQDKVPELAWAGIQVHGTRVHIQVVEKIENVTPAPNQPQNIVATKKGTVREIFVHKGKAAIVRGDLVQPGQVLITGSLADGQTNVHASGKIEASVYYPSKVTVPLKTTIKKYTGDAAEKEFLTFWGYPVQVWGYGQLPYKQVEEQPEDKALKIGSFVFPIQFRHTVYREVETEQITLTEAEAERRGLELAKANVMSMIGQDGRVETQKVLRKELKDGKLEIEILNVAVEDIGKPQAFTPAPPAPNGTDQKPAP